MKYFIIPILLLLTSCIAKEIPLHRPYLNSLVEREEGGICMSEEDAKELLIYIRQLEER